MKNFGGASDFSVDRCEFNDNRASGKVDRLTSPSATIPRHSIDNRTSRKETLNDNKALCTLRNEAASGVSYNSLDRSKRASATLPEELAREITAPEPNDNDFVFFICSTSPVDVREYGESAAKQCKDQGMLLVSVFLSRLETLSPADANRRLISTMAYQLAMFPRAPEALRRRILGALHREPDLLEHNLADQFDKLIVRPLVHVHALDPASAPAPVFLLDSVQSTAWATAQSFVHELVHAVSELHGRGVNARAVITGVGYGPIVRAFEDGAMDGTATRIYALPLTAPTKLGSRARVLMFPLLNWKYEHPQLAKCIMGMLVGTAVIYLLYRIVLYTLSID